MENKGKIIGGFVISLFIVAIFIASIKGIETNEKIDCQMWQLQSKKIRRDIFYITPNQKSQCDALGIKIDAPVKKGGE